VARTELSDADIEVAERYLRDELHEAERAAFELRLLAEAELFEQVQVLELAEQALGAPGTRTAVVPLAMRRTVPPLRPPVWLGWAAALLLCIPAGLWLRERVQPPPDVKRDGAPKTSLTIENAVHLVPGTPNALPRGLTLLDAPAPAGSASDVMRVALLGPRGEVPLREAEARPFAGRVLCVVDTRALAPGPWRLVIELVRVDGAVLETAAFELVLPG
jgi:hypothetical protein